MSEMAFVATDDEVLAVDFLVKGRWDRPLGTVTVDSPDELAGAVRRGMRSLRLRGLIDDHQLSAELAPLALSTTKPLRLVLAVVDQELNTVAGAERFELCGDGAEWVLNAIDGTGVHRMTVLPAEDGAEFLAHCVVARSSLSDKSQLCLLGRTADGAIRSGLVADDGSVTSLHATPDRALTIGNQLEPSLAVVVPIVHAMLT